MELVVGLVLTAIIGTITLTIVFNQSNAFNQMFHQTAVTVDTRKAIRMLRQDIQNMSTANLKTMQPSDLLFTNNNGQDVRYVATDGAFYRNENEILPGIQEAPFSYLNSDGNETAVQDSVVFIGVRLNINRNDETIVMEETIYARN